ncbi:MAG: hypothetical protein ACJ790_22795 [Myxococcaceae bacterium]
MDRVLEAVGLLLAQRGRVRSSELAHALGISVQAASKWLKKLERLGDLVRESDSRYGSFRRAPSEGQGSGHPSRFWHELVSACPHLAYVEVRSIGTARPRLVSQFREPINANPEVTEIISRVIRLSTRLPAQKAPSRFAAPKNEGFPYAPPRFWRTDDFVI